MDNNLDPQQLKKFLLILKDIKDAPAGTERIIDWEIEQIDKRLAEAKLVDNTTTNTKSSKKKKKSFAPSDIKVKAEEQRALECKQKLMGTARVSVKYFLERFPSD